MNTAYLKFELVFKMMCSEEFLEFKSRVNIFISVLVVWHSQKLFSHACTYDT